MQMLKNSGRTQRTKKRASLYIREATGCLFGLAAVLLSACGSPGGKSSASGNGSTELATCVNGPTGGAIRMIPENPRAANPALPIDTVLTAAHTSAATLTGLSGNCLLQTQMFSLTSDTYYSSSIVKPTGGSLIYTPTAPEFQQLNSIYQASSLQNLMNGLGMNLSSMGRIQIDAHCNVSQNAYFSPSDRKLCLGYVLLPGYRRVWAADDADVIIHESGHAVNHALSSSSIMNSSGEAGAIDESVADYWAYTTQNDPQLSEWFLGAVEERTSSTGIVRDATGNALYPSSMVYQVHRDSEALTQTLWQLRTSLGTSHMNALVASTMTMLPATTRFADFYKAFYDAAELHYGSSNPAHPSLSDIRAKFTARGIHRNDSAAGMAAAFVPGDVIVIDDHSYSFQTGGNCNGVLDVGETALVLVNLNNPGSAMGMGVASLTAYSGGLTVPSGGGVGEYFRLNANQKFTASLPPAGSSRKDAVAMASFVVKAVSSGAKTLTLSFQPMAADPLAAANPAEMITAGLTVGTAPTSNSNCSYTWP